MIQRIIDTLIKRKQSVTELVTEYLHRIEKYNCDLNAYITVDKEGALMSAKGADKRISLSTNRKELFDKYPLLGVPIAHKDIFSTKGIETTAGSNILRGYIPPYSATVVRKLKNAGAITLGKLNCDAFAHGASGENSDFGATKNPYDTKRVPGGSSSGSGASVAANMCVAATGTDTGGSIRSPASYCNAVGIKPTYGQVSRYGVIAMASSTDSIGHITKTVRDSARVLSVTEGMDTHDATTHLKKPGNYLEELKKSIKGLSVGIPKEFMGKGVNEEVKRAVLQSANILEKQGACISEVSLPHNKYALSAYYIVQPSEVSSNLGRFDGIRYGKTRNAFGKEAKRRIIIGTYTLSAGYYDKYYEKAQKVRTLIAQDYEKVFDLVDCLLAPVSPVLPPKIGEKVSDPLAMYLLDVFLVSANLAGVPSLSVPAAFSKSGLPIGVQFIGKHFDESTLFKVGYALETKTKCYEREPDNYGV